MKDSPPNQSDRPLSLLERKAWLVALAVTVIGFFMRLPEIFPWWLNPDEGVYFSMLTWKASAPFWAEMVGNANPPLYYLVIHALGLLTHNFAAIRALSLVFGTAAIYAAWLAGREIAYSERFGIFTGLFSALFVAVSPGAILFSQIIRPYTMLLLFLLLALYQLLRFRRERRTANLILYSVFLSIALLTHYSSLLAFGVFGILILSDLISGRFGFRDWPRLLAAHAVPVMICLGLYLYHLRPHMVNSALADEALNGWLASFMIYEVKDIGGRLIGFMGYLFGARLAGLAALIWAAGVALAYRKRSWTLLVVSLAAFGIAVIVAAMGYYPFGCSRHSTWLIAFFVFPAAWLLAQIATSNRRTKFVGATLIVLLFVAAGPVGYLLGAWRVQTQMMTEHVLKKTDLASIRSELESDSGPGIVLMSTQTYYLLLPLFVNEREDVTVSPDGSFFVFQWGSREVVVVQSWTFSVDPDDIGKPNHLYTFVRNADRSMPRLQLGKLNEVQLFFGGWWYETANRLLQADESLPSGAKLIAREKSVPGLTVLTMDIARYRLVMREALKQRNR